MCKSVSKKVAKMNSKTKWYLLYQTNLIALENYEKKITLDLHKTQILAATHHDCSGLLHTFDECKKYIESTVRIGTHVKPVIFTLIIFAVYW